MREKSPIQIPICDMTPTAPSRGSISLFSKADGVYTVDETGEERKLGSGGGEDNAIPSDVAERIEKLENHQKRVNVEFIDNLDSLDNIHTLDKLRFLNGEVEILKSSKVFEEDFETSDIIDYTSSLNVKVDSGRLLIDDQLNTVSNGMMTTKEIEVETTDYITLNSVENKPNEYIGDYRLYNSGKQWVLTEVDSFDNVWIFSIQHRTYTTAITIHLKVYSKTGDLVFQKNYLTSTTKFATLFGGEITFDKFGNTHLLIVVKDDPNATGTHAGYNFNVAATGTSGTETAGYGGGNLIQYLELKLSPSGSTLKTTTYLRKLTSSSYVRGLGITSSQKHLFSANGYSVKLIPPTGFLVTSGSTNANVIKYATEVNSNLIQIYTTSDTGQETLKTSFSPLVVGANSEEFPFFWNLFKRGEDIYLLWNSKYEKFAQDYHCDYRLSKIDADTTEENFKQVYSFIDNSAPITVCGGINGSVYCSSNDSLYLLSSTSTKLMINRFKFSGDTLVSDLVKEHQLEKPIFYTLYCHIGINARILERDGIIHIAYIGDKEFGTGTSLRYLSIDLQGNIVTPPSIVAYKETLPMNQINMNFLGDNLIFAYGYGETTSDTGCCEMAIWKAVPTDITYEVLNVNTGVWHNTTNGTPLLLDSPTDKLKLRATLTSHQYYVSPSIDRIVLGYKTEADKANMKGEMTTKRLHSVSSSGRGVLTADYMLNDGTIDWFVSFDGGVAWKVVQIGYEFIFNYIDTPDFRVKAVIQIPTHDAVSPVISSYTLRTDSVVLHSDIEEIQVNLMKTNFKIDSFTKATKNDLLKMTIDTFSDDSGIDYDLSTCTFNPVSCSVGGDVVVSREEETSSAMTYILLTSDEMLPYKESYIEYYVSRDAGKTYTKIDKDIKSTVIKPSTGTTNTVKIKALLFNGAELNAWAWAWN